MSDRLARYVMVQRLLQRGHELEHLLPAAFPSGANSWAIAVRQMGLSDVDAQIEFENAAATFGKACPSGNPVRKALSALEREGRLLVTRMSEIEGWAAMLHWMQLRQIKTQTRRIAATVSELTKELGVDPDTVSRWLETAEAAELVTHYRPPKPGDPEYFCLTEVGLARAAYPERLEAQSPTAIPPGRRERPDALRPLDVLRALRRQLELMQGLDERSGRQWLAETAVLLERAGRGDLAGRFRALSGDLRFSAVGAFTTAAWSQMEIIIREAIAAGIQDAAPSAVAVDTTLDSPEMHDLSEATRRLEGSAWIPLRKLGSGGGGAVYLCVKRGMVDLVTNFGEEIQQAACAKVVGGARPARHFSESVPTLLEHLLSRTHQRDGLAAIKMPHLDREPSSPQRFRRELEAMKTHRHPALIRLIDFDRTDPPGWLAMEFHSSGVLQDEENRTRFRGKALETLHAVRPVAEALGVVHRRGDVHRDVKPNNIFVAAGGSLVLGDWGVALLGPEPTRLTEAAPAHSRDWVPDWVQFGEERTYTSAVDVFALAKVIYTLVTGENVMASQFARGAEVLLGKHPGAQGLHAMLSLLRKCIVEQPEKMTILDGSSLLEEIDALLTNESSAPRQELVLHFLSTHTMTALSMVNSNHPSASSDLPALPALSQPVHISGSMTRFEARARYQDGPGAIQFRIAGVASDRCELPRTPDDHPGVWTDPIQLRLDAPISAGWHQLTVQGAGSAGLSGFLLYAMR